MPGSGRLPGRGGGLEGPGGRSGGRRPGSGRASGVRDRPPVGGLRLLANSAAVSSCGYSAGGRGGLRGFCDGRTARPGCSDSV